MRKETKIKSLRFILISVNQIHIWKGGTNWLNLTKRQVEIIGFFIFMIFYLLFFNLIFRPQGSDSPVYAPGTLIFAFLGYLLGGYIYDKYLKSGKKP